MRGWRMILISVLVISAVALLGTEPALAQCAMCKQTVESSSDAEALSRTMNLAVLVLLAPPVAIFAGIFGLVYRTRNSRDQR